MLPKECIIELEKIIKNRRTSAVCLFSRTGDKDGKYVTNHDEIDSAWDAVDIMMIMLMHEFEHPERNSLVITRFLNKLGFYPTLQEVEGAYQRFHSPPNPNIN